MPALLIAIWEFCSGAIGAVGAWGGEALAWVRVAFPAAFKWLGVPAFLQVGWDFLAKQVFKAGIERAVRGTVILVGLGLWAGFLLLFWSFLAGAGIMDLFSTNPFSGAPAAVMYLVSNAFPLKFMIGTTIAFYQWRLTVYSQNILASVNNLFATVETGQQLSFEKYYFVKKS